jgi:rhodanese-related sulfurtransferase
MKLLCTLAAALFFVGCATADGAKKADSAPVAEAPPAAAPAPAAAVEKPAEPAFAHMNWDQVATAMASGATLCDARSKTGYDAGHIKGAVHTPYKAENGMAVLPADKASQLVFYCGGPSCSASFKAAKVAAGLGYTNIGEYKGGYPEWAKLNAAK